MKGRKSWQTSISKGVELSKSLGVFSGVAGVEGSEN